MKSPTPFPLVKNSSLHWLQGIFETVPNHFVLDLDISIGWIHGWSWEMYWRPTESILEMKPWESRVLLTMVVVKVGQRSKSKVKGQSQRLNVLPPYPYHWLTSLEVISPKLWGQIWVAFWICHKAAKSQGAESSRTLSVWLYPREIFIWSRYWSFRGLLLNQGVVGGLW